MSKALPSAAHRPHVEALLYGLFLLAVCLAFQGSRGLFEPDEGRYADAALAMLDSGDWLVPRLQGLIYLDKPPAVYWSIAAGFKLLGVNEWGARLGLALALAATAWLVAAWSSAAWGRRAGGLAGAVYVTSLFPALAANALTPDTLLVVWTLAASLCYWRWRGSSSPGERWRWALLLGLAAGLGMLTKGTAALVFLAPVVLHAIWESGPRRLLSRPELWAAVLLGLGAGLSWYLVVAGDVPGAARYFFDNQIAGRLWQSNYARHPEWWAAGKIYLPIILLGGLPWSITWLGLWPPREGRRILARLWHEPLNRFLLLSTLLPLAVLSLASSKLHLYILPLSPYLVMLTIAQARLVARPHWRRWVPAAIALVFLLKGTAAFLPAKHDSRALAAALSRAGLTADECIDAVQTKVHGLGLYGYSRVGWHTIWPEAYPYFEAPALLENGLGKRLQQCNGRIRVLVEDQNLPTARDRLADAQLACSEEPINDRFGLFSCTRDSLQAPDRVHPLDLARWGG